MAMTNSQDSAPYAMATFQGEAWIMDRATAVDDSRWTYPITKAEYDAAEAVHHLFDWDNLSDAAGAPSEAREWDGPFQITVEVLAVSLADLNPTLDAQNLDILTRISERMDRKAGPRPGDFVRFGCGTERRITYDWGDDFQTSKGGSFCVHSGTASFSGTFAGPSPKADLIDTGQTQPGEGWFFSHGDVRAHNGVTVRLPFRLFTSPHEAPR